MAKSSKKKISKNKRRKLRERRNRNREKRKNACFTIEEPHSSEKESF